MNESEVIFSPLSLSEFKKIGNIPNSLKIWNRKNIDGDSCILDWNFFSLFHDKNGWKLILGEEKKQERENRERERESNWMQRERECPSNQILLPHSSAI